MKKGGVAVANRSIFKENFDPFEILGINPSFNIDAQALDAAYFARQALAHPDRFVHHSEPERQAATVQASSLNRAYEILKNPTLRAKALLQLQGIELNDDEKTVQDPEILGEMIDLQEALMNAASPYDLNLVESQIQNLLQEVMVSFARAVGGNQDNELQRLFLRLRYLSKLMGDIKALRRQSSMKVL